VEKYLMSEREFEDFFLTAWVEKAGLKVPGKSVPLREEALLETLRAAVEFKHLFKKFEKRGLPAELTRGLLRRKWNKRVSLDEIGAAVQGLISELGIRNGNVSWREAENGDGAVIEISGDLTAQFGPELLRSAEFQTLVELHQRVPAFHKGPCLVVDGGGKEIPVRTVEELVGVVFDDAREGSSIQRYKGLGEMNPEQLWQTTMNPETRTLLKVTMEDAVGADEMFTVLMGDAVEPRREFIEKFALDVANLDI